MITNEQLQEVIRYTIGGKEVFPPDKPVWVASVSEMAAELLTSRDRLVFLDKAAAHHLKASMALGKIMVACGGDDPSSKMRSNDPNTVADAIITELLQRREEERWTSVTKRLPKDNYVVWVNAKMYGTPLGVVQGFIRDGLWHHNTAFESLIDVDMWQEIVAPKLPAGPEVGK